MGKASDTKSFAVDVYRNINLDQLLMFAVKAVLDNGEDCTFERLVHECFTLFPKRFGFQRYPHWPDSVRINKTWLRCRTDKGWLSGNVKEGFRLTRSGELVAKRTEKELGDGRVDRPIRHSKKTRERYEAMLVNIRNSSEFRRFIDNEADDISSSDLRAFLGGTLETPKRILRHNLNQYLEAAHIYDDSAVEAFLNLCRRRLRGMKE